jgi:hypothetical protein
MLKKFVFIIFTFLTACVDAADQPVAQQCSRLPPGEIDITPNTPDAIRLIPVTLSAKAVSGYIATEYIGAPNLQASIYIYENERYCFSGDLGPFTGYVIDPTQQGSSGYFDLIIRSRSGVTEFIRRFRFAEGLYGQISCKTLTDGNEQSCSFQH